MSDIQKIVINNLKRIRLSKNMTQQDIADKLTKLRNTQEKRKDYTPITRATISKYENGNLGISMPLLYDLSKILEVPIPELFNSEVIYEDNDGYSIKLVNFDKKIFENLDDKTKNKMIDDAIYELSKLKHEMNQKK